MKKVQHTRRSTCRTSKATYRASTVHVHVDLNVYVDFTSMHVDLDLLQSALHV